MYIAPVNVGQEAKLLILFYTRTRENPLNCYLLQLGLDFSRMCYAHNQLKVPRTSPW
jgi:hypothetical protein